MRGACSYLPVERRGNSSNAALLQSGAQMSPCDVPPRRSPPGSLAGNGTDLYAYVGNDPIGGTAPEGLTGFFNALFGGPGSGCLLGFLGGCVRRWVL
jgi:hypothetical protein